MATKIVTLRMVDVTERMPNISTWYWVLLDGAEAYSFFDPTEFESKIWSDVNDFPMRVSHWAESIVITEEQERG